MKKLGIALVTLAVAGAVFAAGSVKTYQMTGPVVTLTDTVVTIQKGEDKWAFARKEATKVTGNLKVGATVTIDYRMVATSIVVK
jgi:hypothetical protein